MFNNINYIKFTGNILVNWFNNALSPYFEQVNNESGLEDFDLRNLQRTLSIESCNFLLSNGIIRCCEQENDLLRDDYISSNFKVCVKQLYL